MIALSHSLHPVIPLKLCLFKKRAINRRLFKPIKSIPRIFYWETLQWASNIWLDLLLLPIFSHFLSHSSFSLGLLPRQHTTGILSQYSGCGRDPHALSPSRWVLGSIFPLGRSDAKNCTWHLCTLLSFLSGHHGLQRLYYVPCGTWVCRAHTCPRLQHHNRLYISGFKARSCGSSCLLGTSVGCQAVI